MRENKLNIRRLMIHSAPGIKWLLLLPVCCCSSAQPVTQPSLSPNSSELYSTFDPSMAIIILVIISSFFFIALFSIYVRHCYDSTAGEAPPSRAAVNIFQKRGLDPAVIESFPTFIYSAVKDLKLGKGALECAVCLSEFEDDETLRLLPKCDHVFHPECIDSWLASHVTCPVCRANLTPDHNETVKSTDSNNELNQNQNNSGSESGGIVIDINDEQGSSELQVMETPSRNDVVPPKFSRSHSTGHSLAQAGVSVERYTLRLPEEIRKQIIMSGKYKRAQSFNVILARQGGSIRGGYRSGGEGSSRGRSYADRWIFSMTPPFVSKAGSLNPMKVGNGGEGDGSSNGRTLLTAVKVPLNCLNVKVEQGEESSSSRTRPQI